MFIKVLKIPKIKISKVKVLIFSTLLGIIVSFNILSSTLAMQHYQKVDFSTGLVTATALNVREGPSTSYKIITQVYKNEYIRVFARIGNWYVIQTDKDYVGAVSASYIKPIYPSTGNSSSSGTTSSSNLQVNLSQDELEVFNLINQKRVANGLKALAIDKEVVVVARDKAKDMLYNNYFSHTSPTYGSPFDMLKKYGINYKTAGENLAGNSSNTKAVEAWMNSEGHRANILNASYQYTGIGVVSSNKYGKIYVQLFIGR